MEYLRDRGTYDDLPLDEMLATFKQVYGTETLDGSKSALRVGFDEFTAPDRRAE